MYKEKAFVLEKSPGMAKVAINRSVKCTGCTSCTGKKDEKRMIASVLDPIGAREGDYVLITSRGSRTMKDAFLLFFYPVMMVVAGYYAGQAMGNTGTGMLISLVPALVPFLYFKLRKKKSPMHIEKILKNLCCK